jgi:DNA-binding NtrC family response regulator
MKPGDLIAGRYRVKSVLASGTKPPSCIASEARGGRRRLWVIKLLPHSEGRPLHEALRADILDLASLRHPALALPAAFGRDARTGAGLLLRPYIEGADILAAARGKGPQELLLWLLDAVRALDLLHRTGAAHGNLKSSNLIVPRAALFRRRSRRPAVILVDPLLDHGLGERGRAEGDVGTREAGRSMGPLPADLMALGKVFYALLAGHEPCLRDDGFPPPPSELRPDVPRQLDGLVLNLLHARPGSGERQASAVVEDLERLCRGKAVSPYPAAECFVGREEEMASAAAALKSGSPAAGIAVAGEAGMGKSAFLRRLSIEAQLLEYRTACIRSSEEKGTLLAPFGAVAERLVPAGSDGRAWRARCRRLLRGLLRTGATALDDAPAPSPARTVLEELIEFLGRIAPGPPILLSVDDVQLADPLTIELLAALARRLAATETSPGACPLRLAVAYRSETPFRAALKPLVEALTAPGGRHVVLELPPLGPEAVEEWLRRAIGSKRMEEGRAESLARLRGVPFAVGEAIRLGAAGALPGRRDIAAIHGAYVQALLPPAREILEALAVLGRPAPGTLIAALVKRPRAEVRSALAALVAEGTLREEERRVAFRHGSFEEWLAGTVPVERKKGLHGRIASLLEKLGGEPIEEVASHWLRSEAPERGVPSALKAGRRLARLHEHRRALVFYQAALDLSPRAGRARRALAEEAAEVFARAGEQRRAAGILEALLRGAGTRTERARLHGRLGILRHRAGDVVQAAAHLEKALALTARSGLAALRERLRVESELAEMASNQGEYSRAEAICRRALAGLARRRAGRRDAGIRRAEMVLLETLAHLRLRRFEYGKARALFERSLKLSETAGSDAERSLILNNLGILHNQENRFREAIECTRRAERYSRGSGDDSSLVNIESNLALLFAKTGDPVSADEALRRAARHEERCESRRLRFLRLHAAGVVDLYFGRYDRAAATLEAATTLGTELQDFHLVGFDLAYLGECHLLSGDLRAARRAFERALRLEAKLPAPVRAMVAARQAALAALACRRAEARAACETCTALGRGTVPFLESGNRLFLGWAHRLLGERNKARAALAGALRFFARVNVPAGEIHAALELAALEADAGEHARARRRLAGLRARFTPGRAALQSPMLAARLLAYEARLFLEGAAPEPARAAALLVEAEGFLIGRRLRDLEELVDALRRRLRRAGLSGSAPTTKTSGPSASRPAPGAAELLAGRSEAIRKVLDLVRRLAPAPGPVLITGETGAGKELVARALHEASPRRAGPFVSLNCAALPGELLEAELFGHARGAFTGADKERRGLLLRAQGGTFFFDEIGDLPLGLQGKLLHVLDTACMRPLGKTDEVAIDARLLFATNRDLAALAAQGGFRPDLLFRLGALAIPVPPLRERLEDLPGLVERFLGRATAGAAAPCFDGGSLDALAAHAWPGNVRELKNVVERLSLTASDRIGAAEVRAALGDRKEPKLFSPVLLRGRPLTDLQEELHREYLLQLHTDCGGDLRSMARALSITLPALYKRFRALRLRPGDFP